MHDVNPVLKQLKYGFKDCRGLPFCKPFDAVVSASPLFVCHGSHLLRMYANKKKVTSRNTVYQNQQFGKRETCVGRYDTTLPMVTLNTGISEYIKFHKTMLGYFYALRTDQIDLNDYF